MKSESSQPCLSVSRVSGLKPRFILLSVLCILLIATGVHGAGLETVIVPPAGQPAGGQQAIFAVYIHNTGPDAVQVFFPGRATCRFVSGGRTAEAPACFAGSRDQVPMELEPGRFFKARYKFTIPRDFVGPVHMTVAPFTAAGVMFAVAESPQPGAVSAGITAHPQEDDDPGMESLFSLYQPYMVNFGVYEPVYFLVGTEPEKSKFQVSFKYRLFNPAGSLVKNHAWLQGIHLGFTQTSFWDLKSDSAPFADTSYKPELFFLSSNIKSRPAWMRGFFIQTGFQHESNGRGGDLSRSTNFAYFKPGFIFYDPATRYGLQVAPKIWAYIGNDNDTNPDLDDYRGYFELDLKVGRANSLVLGSCFRWACQGASLQLDLSYPVHHFLGDNLDLYFHVQYENALAESLLYYTERSQALRLGFSIVR